VRIAIPVFCSDATHGPNARNLSLLRDPDASYVRATSESLLRLRSCPRCIPPYGTGPDRGDQYCARYATAGFRMDGAGTPQPADRIYPVARTRCQSNGSLPLDVRRSTHNSSWLGVKEGLQRTVRFNRCRRHSPIIRTDCRAARVGPRRRSNFGRPHRRGLIRISLERAGPMLATMLAFSLRESWRVRMATRCHRPRCSPVMAGRRLRLGSADRSEILVALEE
jgi:hypothetical protein